jgi:hypothetical protein
MPLSPDLDRDFSPPVFAERDPLLAAAQTLVLLDDTDHLEHSGNEARSWTASHHGVEVVSQRLANWYLEIG